MNRPAAHGFGESLTVPFSIDMACHVRWECNHANYWGAETPPDLPKGLTEGLKQACGRGEPLDDLGTLGKPITIKTQPSCPLTADDKSGAAGRGRWLPVSKRYGPYSQVAPLALVHALLPDGGRGAQGALARHTVVQQPVNVSALADVYASFAERFIQQHRAPNATSASTAPAALPAPAPFFLWVATHHVHNPMVPSRAFQGQSRALGPYGDAMLEVDAVVGRVSDALARAGVAENTLLFATSDNGPYANRAFQLLGGQFGPFDRGGKGTVFEGGHRVWAFAHWPGHVKAGHVSHALTSAMDLMPTFASLAGVQLPRDRVYDGRDLSAVLFEHSQHHHGALLCFGSKSSAARIGRCAGARRLARSFPSSLSEHLRLTPPAWPAPRAWLLRAQLEGLSRRQRHIPGVQPRR